MRAHEIVERFAGAGGDRRAWRVLLVACLLYVVGFLAFYPTAITNDDESMYVRQTLLVLEGTSVIPKVNPLTGAIAYYRPSTYPYGTALSMAPAVALFGWRGAYLVPCLALVGGVLLLGRWLEQEGRSPLFALLMLGYAPALVMGRVAMSDVPSLFFVTLGLWFFWRGIERGWVWWLASGVVAGGSMLFRESNPIPFAPFFAGALLRRERNVWALVVGGVCGLALRVGANALFIGEPFFYRSPYILELGGLVGRLPIYALALLVFVPGGFVFALLYRGRRWPELCVAVAGFVTAYLIQTYYTFATSLLKNMIITPRYVIPIIPVVVFGMAESMPRLWQGWLAALSGARGSRLRAAGGVVVALWIAGVGLGSFAVHPALAWWGGKQADIRDAVAARIDLEAVVLSNLTATRKFVPDMEMKFAPVNIEGLDSATGSWLVRRWGEVYCVVLDRSDSPFWREEARRAEHFISGLQPEPELIFDQHFTATDRLRIWRVSREGHPTG